MLTKRRSLLCVGGKGVATEPHATGRNGGEGAKAESGGLLFWREGKEGAMQVRLAVFLGLQSC